MFCKLCKYSIKGLCSLEIAHICPFNSFKCITEISNLKLGIFMLNLFNEIKRLIKNEN